MNYWNKLHTNVKGSIGEHKLKLELVKHVGPDVFEGSFNGSKTDLVFYLNNKYFGIQVKNGKIDKEIGHLYFRTCSFEGRKNYKSIHYNKKRIDFIGVYSVELDKCYLIPISDVGDNVKKTLRITPPLIKHSSSNINWAKDYELDKIMIQLKENI